MDFGYFRLYFNNSIEKKAKKFGVPGRVSTGQGTSFGPDLGRVLLAPRTAPPTRHSAPPAGGSKRDGHGEKMGKIFDEFPSEDQIFWGKNGSQRNLSIMTYHEIIVE